MSCHARHGPTRGFGGERIAAKREKKLNRESHAKTGDGLAACARIIVKEEANFAVLLLFDILVMIRGD